jgi:hypothetical protein
MSTPAAADEEFVLICGVAWAQTAHASWKT